MNRSKYRRFGWAVYLFLGALAVIFLLAAGLPITNDRVDNILINLSTDLFIVVLVFFLVVQFFQWDLGDLLQEQIDLRLKKMDLYQSKMEQLGEEIERSTKGTIDIFPNRQSIWDGSINILKKGQWDKLCIFAPVGLWHEDEDKREWLKQVAECADSTPPQIQTVQAVYGLPPKLRESKEKSYYELAKELRYFRDVLNVFKDLKNIELHYYPPMPASVGVGAIIIENNTRSGGVVAFAMASHGDAELIDAGLSLDNQEIFFLAREWFTVKVFRVATGDFILQDSKMSIEKRWPTIIEQWYPEVKQYYCAETNELTQITSQLEKS